MSILIPFILSTVFGIYLIGKWKLMNKNICRRLYHYLKNYETFLLVLSVFVGFYSAVDICQSRLYYLHLTNLSLTRNEYSAIKYYRTGNIVLLENLPQFIIQSYYIFATDNNDSLNEIAVISLAFSILSIVISIIVRVNELLTQYKFKILFKHKSKVGASFIIESDKINKYHIFSNECIANCLENGLRFALHEQFDKFGTLLTIEVFYIERLNENQINVYLTLRFYSNVNDDNINDNLIKQIKQSLTNINIKSYTSIKNDNIIARHVLASLTKRLKLDNSENVSISFGNIWTIYKQSGEANVVSSPRASPVNNENNNVSVLTNDILLTESPTPDPVFFGSPIEDDNRAC